MIKVVLTGIFYPMAILRYFEAALRRRDDVELYAVGPYTGAWIPWNGGMNLPAKYAGQPDVPFPGRQIRPTMPTEYIEKLVPCDKPDLWLQIDAGFHLVGRPSHGKNVIVATDPHVLNYDEQRSLADTFYCMQKVYAKPGDVYLPYAYDPVWHSPQNGTEREFDACLLGLHYPQRNELVQVLRDRGLKVKYDLGPVYNEAREWYSQASIGLNWSSKEDLVARVFELLGMRRLAVVNRVPDLPLFFQDGKDLVVFDNLQSAVEKVMYYHTHPDELEAIACQGHKAVQPHTWDARVAQILEEL